MTLTFGKVPHPEYQNHLYVSEKKIEGSGWDNLGPRKPKFIALHRMYGTLAGTLSYFKPPTAPHLTDYAIGVKAIDGANAGVIHKYNDPTGFRSGWASGRVSAPYGAGKAIVDKYGINAVNRDGVSIELSGYWETPVDDYSWSEYVKLIAYWVDQMKIPHDSLPLNPHTGIDAFIWHQEFTIGTGKVCPGKWLMDRTGKLYDDVAAYLKPFQTGEDVATPEPKPTEPTTPTKPIGPLIPYPTGLNKQRASWSFSFVIGEDDVKYAFDESGPVSNLWLSYATEHKRYPRLEDVQFEGKTKLFMFSDGSVIVAAPGQPVVYL